MSDRTPSIRLVADAEARRKLNHQEAQFLQRRFAFLSKLAERGGSAEAFDEPSPVDNPYGFDEVFEDWPAHRIEYLAQWLGGFA